MDWHCGLLDEPATPPGERNPIRDSNWHTLPPELERELRIWLAMPGFSLQYHVETLEREPREIRRFMGSYNELEEDVLCNWVSATREDCLKLGWMRPEKGRLPLISQCQIRRDYFSVVRQTQKELAAEYGVYPSTVNKLTLGIPDEYDSLPPRLRDILESDLAFIVSSRREFRLQRTRTRTRTRRLLPQSEFRPSPEVMEKMDEYFRTRPKIQPAVDQPAVEKPKPRQLSPAQITRTLEGASKHLNEARAAEDPRPAKSSHEGAIRLLERMSAAGKDGKVSE